MLPPRWVRRLVLAPGVVLLSVLVVLTLPVTAAVAGLLSLVLPGQRKRPLRLLWLVVVHLVLEATTLLAMLVLWVASGFGYRLRSARSQRRHYDLVQFYLETMFAVAERILHVRVEVDGPDAVAYHGRPLVVFCRHAGPGDSFLLVHALVNWYDREPRIVLKDTLQWDPAIDVVLNRLPTRFLRPRDRRGRGSSAADIGELARHLDDDDALVIFPEGGNFTERRRARAIDRLRLAGQFDEAAKAEAMRHVLPPRTGGVLAVLDVAGAADVVWVAHTGTDHLFTVADVWRALPTDMVIRMRWWQVPAGDVPAGRDARISWLFTWWHHIDAWIGEQRGERRRRTIRVRLAERRARIPTGRRATRR